MVRALRLAAGVVAAACALELRPRRSILSGTAALGTAALGVASSVAAPDWLLDVPVETVEDALSRGAGSNKQAAQQQQQQQQRRSEDDDAASRPRGGRRPAASSGAQVVSSAQDRARSGAVSKSSRRVTERVRVSLRAARTDGSFSVRDDDEDPPLFGHLDVALYGDAAPAAAALFLGFAFGDAASKLEFPPTYQRSMFDENTGALLVGGKIRGVDEREIFGEKVLTYRDVEALSPPGETVAAAARKERTMFAHDRAGLLTRRRRACGAELPEFGVTLRASPELDASGEWAVFGEVLPSSDPANLLDTLAKLPIYSLEAVGDLAETTPFAADVYRAQKQLFLGAAKAIKDSRASAVFQGKILRRIEVTQVELLSP